MTNITKDRLVVGGMVFVMFTCLFLAFQYSFDGECEQAETRAQAFERCKRDTSCMMTAGEWEVYLNTLDVLEECND